MRNRGCFCATVVSAIGGTIKNYIENQELGYEENIFKIEEQV